MLEGASILCFAPEPWHGMWRSRQQIMSRIAKRNKVLFVEPRVHLKPIVGKLIHGEIRFEDLRQPLTIRVSDGLYVFRPPLLAPICARQPVSAATELARTYLLRRALQRYGFSAPIVWVEHPEAWDWVEKLDAEMTIYRVTDEYSAFVGLSEDGILRAQEREKSILSKADLVLVASESLLSTKILHNPNTHLLSHGVDYAAFVGASSGNHPIPQDMLGLQRPIIGYSGLTNARLDLVLLQELAAAFPYCSLALVGEINSLSCEADIEALRNVKNVHFLGTKRVREVPSYVSAFDVCLIPYGTSEEPRNANPLKLLEYLAAGKPVVSANIPAVREYADIIRVASDRRSFLEQVSMALDEKDGVVASRRKEAAAAHSWDSVIERFGDLVQMTLKKKGDGG